MVKLRVATLPPTAAACACRRLLVQYMAASAWLAGCSGHEEVAFAVSG